MPNLLSVRQRREHEARQALRRDEPKTALVLLGCLDPLRAGGVSDALRAERCLEVVSCDSAGSALEDEIVRLAPRVVVLGEVAHSQLVRIQAGDPPPAILIVAEGRADLVGPLLVGNGISCLAPGATSADLQKAVRLVATGQTMFFRPNGTDRPARIYPTDLSSLTPRELDVLCCLSDGYTNLEIAKTLHISAGTVSTHVKQIFQKLDRRNRRDLIGLPVPQRAGRR